MTQEAAERRRFSYLEVEVEEVEKIPEETMKLLRKTNPMRWLAAALSDWLIIASAFYVAYRIAHPAAYVLAVLLIGNRQHALAVLGHEGAHNIISRRRWVNEKLSHLLCFWPIGVDLNAYRAFHFAHHRKLNTPEDPEMDYRTRGAPGWDLPCPRRTVARRFLTDLLGFGSGEVFRMMRYTLPQSWKAAVGPLALHATVIAVFAVAGHLWVPLLWWVAMFTAFSAYWRFRCWIEHLGTDETHRVHLQWWQAWLLAPHNIWLHWEHHRFPAVPFWNLSKIRAMITSLPVMSLSGLFKFYEQSAVLASGTPTRGADGMPLGGLGASGPGPGVEASRSGPVARGR